MAIDQQIQEKVDAYRNNPEALQKNYQMNQDLLDLLALQKIKSEKDAAARELQMSMEQDPQTIAGQRGEEAIGRTKDDLVKQVGGVAQTLASRQQQNMQRTAAGVASQPAPNMRMAGGGIVSFAPGGAVKTTKELLASVGYTPQAFSALTEIEKQEVLERVNKEILSPTPVKNDPIALNAFRGAVRPMDQFKGSQQPTVQPIDMSRLQYALSNEANKAGDVTSDLSVDNIGPPLSTQPQVRQISKPPSSGSTMPTPSTVSTTKKSDLEDILKRSETSRAERMKETAENLNRSGVAKIRAEQLAQQKTLSEKNAADRKENRFYDLLARAGGQGALADIGRAGSDLRQGDRMQSQLDLDNLFERQDKGIADDITIGTEEIKAGDRLEQIISTASTAERNRISKEAIANLDAKTRVAVANYKAGVQRETNLLKQQADNVKSRDDSRQALLNVQKQLSQMKLDSQERAGANLEKRGLLTGGQSKEEIAAIMQEEELKMYLALAPERTVLEDLAKQINQSLSGFTVKKIN